MRLFLIVPMLLGLLLVGCAAADPPTPTVLPVPTPPFLGYLKDLIPETMYEVSPSDLPSVSEFYVGDSLQKLVPLRIVVRQQLSRAKTIDPPSEYQNFHEAYLLYLDRIDDALNLAESAILTPSAVERLTFQSEYEQQVKLTVAAQEYLFAEIDSTLRREWAASYNDRQATQGQGSAP